MKENQSKAKLGKNSDFAFVKKIGMAECLYGDIPTILNLIGKLLYCMKETNNKHKVTCEYFRLDFRGPYFDEKLEFPLGSLIFDMKWGSKEELKKIEKIE